MGLMDFFRVNQIKAELEQTQHERDALKATVAETEHLTYFELQTAIAQLNERKDHLTRQISDMEVTAHRQQQQLNEQIAELQRQVQDQHIELRRATEAKKHELVLLDEEILLQSFGFYRPKYDLLNAEAYKGRLEQIRQQQAFQVKNGTAASCSTNWTINNSQKEGERMAKDYVKLIVRSFNNECDASIISVKFNNVNSIEKRIRKAFDTLNALGSRMSITISPHYLDLKLQELYLAYEYQTKKQQEKEEQKLLRERLREEAKALKEIEDMKLKLGKEERHFTKALADIEGQIGRASTDAERELLEMEKADLQQQLADVERTKQDIVNREHNTRAGYVYVISNVGAFGENVYKIGVTRRLDPQERVDELGDASVPFDFDIHALIFSNDAPALESALHRAFEGNRLNLINRRREFFHVTLEDIKHVVRTNFNKPVEFIELADAAEYRQSQVLKQGEHSTDNHQGSRPEWR